MTNMGLVLLLNNSPNVIVVGDPTLFFTLNVCCALDTVVEVLVEAPSMLEPFDGRS